MFKDLFKNRAIGFFLSLACSIISLIGAILFIALDGGDKTFSLIGFILAIAAGLSFALVLFVRNDFCPLLPTAFAIGAFAVTTRAMLPSLSDRWNHVNFIGGNAYMGLAFAIVFLVASLLGVVSCYTAQNK